MDKIGIINPEIEDESIKQNSLENIGTVSIKGDLTYLIVKTNKGTVKLELLSTSPDDSIAGVIFNNQDITNKNWEGYKNTPEGVLRALAANGFNLENPEPAGSVKDKITYERNDFGKLEKKVNGAVREMTRQVGLTKSVEDNLSKGLENNKTFVKKSKIIDNKRVLVLERSKNLINDIKNAEAERGIAGIGAIQEAMKELEAELTDPYAKSLYEKLADTNKIILLDYLVDNGVSSDTNEIIEMETISPANFNVVYFTENGYLMQIVNAKEVGNLVNNDKALFNIIAPDGSMAAENINFKSGQTKLKELSDTYQTQLVADFKKDPWAEVFDQEKKVTTDNEPVIGEDPDQAKRIENLMAEYEAEPITDRGLVIPNHILAEQKAEKEKKTDKLLETLYKEPVLSDSEKDALLDTLYQEPKKDDDELLDTLYTESGSTKVESAGLDTEQKNASNTNEQNKEVLKYAENMGIKAEQLTAHPEFLELNSAQQEFVLEALNRSSLNKIKVEANQNFLEEKAVKKWYNLGFAFTQKFHKKKHEVLAAKSIHEKGLDGYGETEFSWLIDVVKNGPEMKVDEDGDLISVNYLRVEENENDETRLQLIYEYNLDAYNFSTKSAGDKDYENYKLYLEGSRNDLLKTTENNIYERERMVTRLIEAERQLKLNQFLKSDPKNEQIIQGLVDNSLGSWQKFAMICGSQKDKAAYMGIGMAARLALRSETAVSMMSKAMSYSVGPVIAAVIGGWRANDKARTELKEGAELSKLGVEAATEKGYKAKAAKNFNLAVGGTEKEGENGEAIVVNIGLADKIERLTRVYGEINHLRNLDYKTPEQEEELSKLLNKHGDIEKRLRTRINYTSRLLDEDSISFGAPGERSVNYYRLVSSLESAKDLIFYENQILNYKPRRVWVDEEITDLTRSNKKIKDISDNKEFKDLNAVLSTDEISPENKKELEVKRKAIVREWYNLNKLNSLSVEQRLASFLDFNEERRKSAEFKYLALETTKGAVVGAAFAAAGSYILEKTGLGAWSSQQLSDLGKSLHLNQAWQWAGNLISSDDVDTAEAMEEITETVEEAVVPESNSNPDFIIEQSPSQINIIEQTQSIQSDVQIEEAPVSLEQEVKAPESETPKTYSDEISNEAGKNNSVWKSLREIFKGNPESLGYKGDMNDAEALNHWAENQTANTLHNSGEITDKVYSGNKVLLTNEGGEFKVRVETGSGADPSYLNQEIPEVEIQPEEIVDVKIEEPISPVFSDPAPVVDNLQVTEIVPETSPAQINELAKFFNISAESIKYVGQDLVYENKSGKIIFDGAKKIIKEVVDSNNKIIPNNFINDIRGNWSLEKFSNKGGLEKIFSLWNKLGANDKTVYESLSLFNQHKLTPFDLINKISGIFQVNATQVSIDLDNNHFLLNGKRDFKMDFDGVQKLVKVLGRRFS